MKRLELFLPVKPFTIFQRFGENSACVRKEPFSVISKTGDACPAGYVDYYHYLGLKGHNGLDIQASTIPVRAAHDGIVIFAGLDRTAGWTVGLRTLDERVYKDGGAYYKTIYCHMYSNLAVKAGQNVRVGDILGYANASGGVSGPHLHFGLKPVYLGEQEWQLTNSEQDNGYYGAIDPEPYFNGIYAESAQTILSILNQQISVLQKIVELFKKLF